MHFPNTFSSVKEKFKTISWPTVENVLFYSRGLQGDKRVTTSPASLFKGNHICIVTYSYLEGILTPGRFQYVMLTATRYILVLAENYIVHWMIYFQRNFRKCLQQQTVFKVTNHTNCFNTVHYLLWRIFVHHRTYTNIHF